MAWNNPQWQAWVYNEKVELESKGRLEPRPGAKYLAPKPSKEVRETFLEGCRRHGLDRANSARERRWFRNSAPENAKGHKFFQIGAWRVISPEQGEYRVECDNKLVSRMTCLNAALNTMRSCMEAAAN